ncbi:GNAT family N-acetyltransferase [Jannaschia seohaensis]|uniref:L-amino acid N-acyltransferase YncA n=1 Tax=Jannaschia seohaensis TaxID=475081 RepID=A0A2Y9B4H1_9RHOB|nr:GNAT family N-acetyltransferase [Jannaschia seohaensis]PWJ11443.1 L-amino acid N-acyltransferase YncA [Jannaschia seohaensis]SSA51414.1 L-amino acid N-acyltransferase YncA [Jannaschia seohaensis]
MTRIHVRPARPFDAGAMAALLNAIIARGGTTAMTQPVTGAQLRDWMAASDIWHVAEAEGEILGFQWIGRHDSLPEGACDIATFVALGSHGLGVGSRLFEATRKAAKAAGHAWIAARIAHYNEGGQAYYKSRGFEDWRRTDDKIIKRYDL